MFKNNKIILNNAIFAEYGGSIRKNVPACRKNSSFSEESFQKRLKRFGDIFHINGKMMSAHSSHPRYLLVLEKLMEAEREGKSLTVLLPKFFDKEYYLFLKDLADANKNFSFSFIETSDETSTKQSLEEIFQKKKGQKLFFSFSLVHGESLMLLDIHPLIKTIRFLAKRKFKNENDIYIYGDFSHSLYREAINFFSFSIDAMSVSLPHIPFLQENIHFFYRKRKKENFLLPEYKNKDYIDYALSSALFIRENKESFIEGVKNKKAYLFDLLERAGLLKAILFSQLETIPHRVSLSFEHIPLHEEIAIRLEDKGYLVGLGEKCKDFQYQSIFLNALKKKEENYIYIDIYPSLKNREI